MTVYTPFNFYNIVISYKSMREAIHQFTSRESFINRVPVGTWIGHAGQPSTAEGRTPAQTMPGRVYDNPNDQYVAVGKIDNVAGRSGIWAWADISPLTPQELEQNGLMPQV